MRSFPPPPQSPPLDQESLHVAGNILLGGTGRAHAVAHCPGRRDLHRCIPKEVVRRVEYARSCPDSSRRLVNSRQGLIIKAPFQPASLELDGFETFKVET